MQYFKSLSLAVNPNAPGQPQLKDKTFNSITVEWTASAQDVTRPLTHYTVEHLYVFHTFCIFYVHIQMIVFMFYADCILLWPFESIIRETKRKEKVQQLIMD